VTGLTETSVPLSACPNNTTHSVDANSASITFTLRSNTVKIQEEAANSITSGFYGVCGRAFTVQPGETKYDAFTPYIPISILAGHLFSRPDLEGDILTAYVIPQNPTVVGYCTADIADASTVLNVSMSVLMMVELEKLAYILLTESATGRTSNKIKVVSMNLNNSTITVDVPIETEDGNPLRAAYGTLVTLDTNIIGELTAPNTTDHLWIHFDTPIWNEIRPGRFITLFQYNQNKTQERMIVQVDSVNKKIKMNTPFNIAMSPSPGNSIYVQLSIRTVDNVELDQHTVVHIGGKTVGGSFISTDSILVIAYTRNGSTPARIRYFYERFY
jgi:hypothetical protein